MGKSSRLRDITQWRLTQRAYELLCTCVVCVASVHVFDTFWAYNDVLKNDNKRAQVFWIKKRKKTTTTEEEAPKKRMNEDEGVHLSDSVLFGCEKVRNAVARRTATHPAWNSRHVTDLGVAHHRLSMDEQSVIRYSLQVAFFFRSSLLPLKAIVYFNHSSFSTRPPAVQTEKETDRKTHVPELSCLARNSKTIVMEYFGTNNPGSSKSLKFIFSFLLFYFDFLLWRSS